MRQRIALGLEVLLDRHPDLVRNKRVGLLTHYAALTSELEFSIDALLERGRCRHITVFAPEHGFWADAQYMDGLREDGWRGSQHVTIRRSYDGTNPTFLSPDPRDVARCDVLVVDVQDVGSRYYTYAASMVKCMGVAKDLGIPVIVADRPNPIGGLAVEGLVNFFEPYISFVGNLPVPNRHGMTIGELALLANERMNIHCDLTVIAMDGWHRGLWWDDLALDFVPPSPNMPSPRAALVYAGMCVLEATSISEGRGTTVPFDIFGAPWLDAFELAERLDALQLDGVRFRPQYFTPTFSKHSGRVASHEVNEPAGESKAQLCGGVAIHVTDRDAFRPVRAGLLALKVMYDMHPQPPFEWRRTHYEFAHCMAIDALTRSSRYQLLVEDGSVDDVREWMERTWTRQEEQFLADREASLLGEYEVPRPAAAHTVLRVHDDVAETVVPVPHAVEARGEA